MHFCLVLGLAGLCTTSLAAQTLGLFEGHNDVGVTPRAGVAVYDPGQRAYTVSGGGANMWFTNDAFHFVWKKVSGEITLAADIRILGAGGDPHRKAVLLVRQSLDPDAAYADAALHGDGLTSLQYRETQGGAHLRNPIAHRRAASSAD